MRAFSRVVATFLLALTVLCPPQAQAAFDHSHAIFDNLLKKHVSLISNGNASQVDYAAIKSERAQLKAYLAMLSEVSNDEYASFSKSRKLAFLINAYNAYTIDFVLTAYPELKSIKDLGSLFSNPWKKELFPLLGKKRSLDDIEHGLIRQPGVFDDARIHMAVNCASIGCPALRNEAYNAERINEQLDDAVRCFLSDRSRNRADKDGLRVSKIFDWYASDFEKQAGSVAAWLSTHADHLTADPIVQQAVRDKSLRVSHLDYDWALNDKR